MIVNPMAKSCAGNDEGESAVRSDHDWRPMGPTRHHAGSSVVELHGDSEQSHRALAIVTELHAQAIDEPMEVLVGSLRAGARYRVRCALLRIGLYLHLR